MDTRLSLLILRHHRRHRRFEDVIHALANQNPELFVSLAFRRERRLLPYVFSTWKLDDWTDVDCVEFLRFTKAQIREMLPYFRLDLCPWRLRIRPDLETALCVVLFRLSWPYRYKDMRFFGRSASWLVIVYNDATMFLCRRYRKMLRWDGQRLTKKKVDEYEKAIEKKSGMPNVWAFVDGTIRAIARPISVDQQPWYTGYKKLTGFKVQAISTPDGLISSLTGPTTAADGDWALWHFSGIEVELRKLFDQYDDNTEPLIYGDPAYRGAYGVIGAFVREPGKKLSDAEKKFNVKMAKVRITIEQLFGLVVKYWASSNLRTTQKMGHSPVAAYYICAVLLTNILTCFQGNQVSEYFNYDPPELDEYLGSVSALDVVDEA